MATVNNIPALKNLVNGAEFQKRVYSILGKNTGSFVASFITMVSEDGKLRQCDPVALASECLKAVSLKLPIVKAFGYAYIVPYFNAQKDDFGNTVKDERGNVVKKYEPQFIPGYKGIIQLALRSGVYQTINADEVYEGELKSINKLTGMPDLTGERKSNTVIGYFAYLKQTNGFEKAVYVSVNDMALHAKAYAPTCARVELERLIELANAPRKGDKGLGWLGDFKGMAIKTCLRKLLLTYGNISTDSDLGQALAADAEAGEKETKQSVVEDVDIDIVEDEQPKQIEQTAQQTATEAVAEAQAEEVEECKAAF